MMGSYYQPALGGQPSTPSEWVNQAAVQLLSGVQPIGLFTPWSQLNGSVWDYVATPESDFNVFAITDAFIKEVEAATFGNQLSFVGVFTDKAVSPPSLEAAFDGTRYKFLEGEALYRQDDPASPPKPWFIYWAVLRGDGEPDGGQGSLQSVAAKLGGQLVYVFPVARSSNPRPHPTVSVSDLTKSSPTYVTEAAASDSSIPWWVLVMTGGLAAYGGYRWYKARRRR